MKHIYNTTNSSQFEYDIVDNSSFNNDYLLFDEDLVQHPDGYYLYEGKPIYHKDDLVK